MPAPEMQTPRTNGASADTKPDATDFNALPKPEATVIAKLALAMHVVHRGQSGDYTVSKHGMTRYCQDLAALQDFARKLGVQV